MRTNQPPAAPTPPLTTVRETLLNASCRLKVLVLSLDPVYDNGVFEDEADGFRAFFSDVIQQLDEVSAHISALLDGDNVRPALRVVNMN